MTDVYLSLGSNIGKRDENLRKALLYLGDMPHTTLKKISKIYETQPVDFTEQALFLNMAAHIQTKLNSYELLSKLQMIEQNMGRLKSKRFGPRIIDIDILLYGTTMCDSFELTIPHPRMFDRAFVLVPLLEICGDMDKSLKKQVVDALKIVTGSGVELWRESAQSPLSEK